MAHRNARPPAGLPHDAPAKRRPGPISITLALALSISLLVILAVSLVLLIGLGVGRQNTLDLLNRQAALLVDALEQGVEAHLEPARRQVRFLARVFETGEVSLADRQRVLDLLTGALAGTPQLSALITWDADHHRIGVFNERDGAYGPIPGDEETRPGIRARLDQLPAEATWGELVFTRGQTFINVGQSLHHDGKVIGYLVAAVSVPELSQIVTEIGDAYGMNAFILQGRDQVVAHPMLVFGHPEQSETSPAVGRLRVGDPVLGALWDAEPVPGLARTGEGDVEIRQVAFGSQHYIVLYSWTERYGTPWVLGAYLPATHVGQEVRRLQLSAAVGLGVLVLAVLAAIGLGRLIARPIVRLADSAALIGSLELERVGTLPRSIIRELNDQARAFNTMLAGLRTFSTYVPRSLVARLIAKGEDQSIVSIERELTVMFTDIVSFTAMAEPLPPSATAAFLNHHFGLLCACVEAELGTVDKYIGDALMAFWGAPEKQKDHALRACRAALAIADAIAADNRQRRARGEPPVRVRIGLHSGPVVVGNIGAPGRVNYTIVGDPVNAGQRLEDLGRTVDPPAEVVILVSGETRAELGDAFRLTALGTLQVKGRAEPLQVFRLLGTS
jgi:adenylate cyclase